MPARHVPLGCEANAAVVRPLRLSAARAASYKETDRYEIAKNFCRYSAGGTLYQDLNAVVNVLIFE
jgi:hypothetical protein